MTSSSDNGQRGLRILIIQYLGDYLSAHKLSVGSGRETYFGHQYILTVLESVQAQFGQVSLVCCNSDSVHDLLLPSGVRIVGAHGDEKKVWRVFEEVDPTHVIVLGPLMKYIRVAVSQRRRILCLFADSFELNPLRRFVRYGALARWLARDEVEWIGNHGINACESLCRLGVPAAKIVPWDWPHARSPGRCSVKQACSSHPKIFFAGVVSERKGVRDLITAVSVLRDRGMVCSLEIAGAGDVQKFRSITESAGLSQSVHFLGLITNDEVVSKMRDSDVVVIPSQHAYPEGLPLTIYEALCVRTPIVASDHPMFVRRLVHEQSALIYRAGHPSELASALERLIGTPSLYESLSQASQIAWDRIQISVKWGDVIRRWLAGEIDDLRWLQASCLSSEMYVGVREVV